MRWATVAARGPALSSTSGIGQAHVRYVVEDEGSAESAIAFVTSVLTEPVNAALVGLGVAAAIVAVTWFRRSRPVPRDLAALRSALDEYRPYLPWMLRLSLGLPLLGAGFAGYLFNPAVPMSVRLPQVALGFLLLFGLATRAAAAVGLLAFLVALVANPSLLLSGEYVGGFVAIVLLGAGRPSADHLLQRVAAADGTLYGRFDPVHRLAVRFNAAIEPYERYAPVAVRTTLGFTFVYLGVWEKLAHPGRALAVVAKYDLTALVPVDPGLWVVGAALVEVSVGLLLLVGLYTRAAAALGFLTLTLTLFGLPDDPVLAHVTLFGLTSMLFVAGPGPRSIDNWLDLGGGRGTADPRPG